MTTQEKDVQATRKLQKSYFDVLGLCCSSEVPLIENILKSLDGVKEYSVIVATRTVIVVHDNLIISQLEIVKALNQARLEANVRVYGGTAFRKKWPSPYAIVSGFLLALSFLKYLYHPLRWLAIGAVAVGICPIALKAFAAIRSFRLDINTLVLIAVIGTIAMKDYTEAGAIVFLFTIAEWLETRASHKANAVMSTLMSVAPQKAVIAETGEEVDASEVKLNTVLAVKAGEVIPIDGIIVDGKCEVDEKTLTGESYPVAKQKDSSVWAGTINLNGYISVKTTALAEHCVVAKMAKLVEEAQNGKSKTQRFIDECSQYYTPAVIVASACLAVIPATLRLANRNHWFHLALVVLVSACPCALILSTPVVTFCALTKAATCGLLIKGGDYLEILAKVNVIGFDKTGTITRGEFVVSDIQSLREDIDVKTLLYWVSSIESRSSHPMATALVEYAKSISIEPKPDSVEDYQNFPGEGIYGKIGGEGIYIGNRKIALRAGCGAVPSIEGFKNKGSGTIGYIYTGDSLVGVFSLSDACRTGAAEAIRELKLMGIKTAMLTGDNQAAAMHAQEQLGNCLEAVHSELLPEDKAKMISQFKNEGPTAMIGDGVNDAPALATADIGISMGISGSALATETGHVILMSNDIRRVPQAIHLARKAHRKVFENIILSIATKAAILALAIDGHPLVWAAVLADVGTCLLVICNSMLILRGTHMHGGKGFKSSASLHTHKHGGKCCDSSALSHSHKKGGNNCKSSAAAHTHKHGGKCCDSLASSHSHKHGRKSCKSSAAIRTHKPGGKCCQSFSKSHPQKHGCDSDGRHSSHYKQHYCTDNNAQKVSEASRQSSSHGCVSRSYGSSSCSSNSCGKNQCKGSAERHSGCEYSDKIHGAKDYCDHGNCNKDNHDIEAQNTHIHGCSGNHNSRLCTNNNCPHEKISDNCVGDCGSSEVKHCGHDGHCDSETDDGIRNHSSHSTCLEEITNHGHCHQVHCSTKHLINQADLELGKVIDSFCCHQHQRPKPNSARLRQCCTYHDKEGLHVESSSVAMNTCISLEKREIGGCCKNYYMKECCSKHGHLGAGLGGGLTEIITE